jgi:hypothetical protein
MILIAAALTLIAAAQSANLPFPQNEGIGGYQLRVENIGFLAFGDHVAAEIASSLMMFVALISWLVVIFFDFATSPENGLASMFGNEIQNILEHVHTNVFLSLFILGFAMTMIIVVKQFAKRNLVGMGTTCAQIAAVYILSFLILQHAPFLLIKSNEFAIEIGMNIAPEHTLGTSSSNSAGSTQDNTKDAMWNDLAGDMWFQLQFMNSSSTYHNVHGNQGSRRGTARAFLIVQDRETANFETVVEGGEGGNRSTWQRITQTFLRDAANVVPLIRVVRNYVFDGDSQIDANQRLVNSYINNNPGAFNTAYSVPRIAYLLAYLPAFLVKCLVYLFVSVMLFFFQIMSIFYIVTSPIWLLASLFPAAGGFELLNKWFRKLIETQIMIVLVAFLLGFTLWVSNVLSAAMIGAVDGGNSIAMTIVVTYLQAIIMAAIALKHNKILGMLPGVGGAVKSQGSAANAAILGGAAMVAGQQTKTVRALRTTASNTVKAGGAVAGAAVAVAVPGAGMVAAPLVNAKAGIYAKGIDVAGKAAETPFSQTEKQLKESAGQGHSANSQRYNGRPVSTATAKRATNALKPNQNEPKSNPGASEVTSRPVSTAPAAPTPTV